MFQISRTCPGNLPENIDKTFQNVPRNSRTNLFSGVLRGSWRVFNAEKFRQISKGVQWSLIVATHTVHGRKSSAHPQIFGQVFDQVVGQVFDQGGKNTVLQLLPAGKYSFRALQGPNNTVKQHDLLGGF